MNARVSVILNPHPALLPLRSGVATRASRKSNRAYLKAMRDAEEVVWKHRAAERQAQVVGRLLATPTSDRAEQRLMLFLLALAIVAVGSVFLAGLSSGDVTSGVRALVEGVTR